MSVANCVEEVGQVLKEAHELINGHRRDDYGSPTPSFTRVANYWNTYMFHKDDPHITPFDVSMMMVLFKLARLENKYTHDSVVDMAGYLGLYDYMVTEYKQEN